MCRLSTPSPNPQRVPREGGVRGGCDTDGDTVGSEVVGEIDGDACHAVGSELVGNTDGDKVGFEVVGDTDGDTEGTGGEVGPRFGFTARYWPLCACGRAMD